MATGAIPQSADIPAVPLAAVAPLPASFIPRAQTAATLRSLVVEKGVTAAVGTVGDAWKSASKRFRHKCCKGISS